MHDKSLKKENISGPRNKCKDQFSYNCKRKRMYTPKNQIVWKREWKKCKETSHS